jgi:hypothetical protein
MTDNCAARVPVDRGDITRVVNHSCVRVAGIVYTHPNLTAHEGRSVVLRPTGEDPRALRAFAEGGRTAPAGDEIAVVAAIVDGELFGDVVRRRPTSS